MFASNHLWQWGAAVILCGVLLFAYAAVKDRLEGLMITQSNSSYIYKIASVFLLVGLLIAVAGFYFKFRA